MFDPIYRKRLLALKNSHNVYNIMLPSVLKGKQELILCILATLSHDRDIKHARILKKNISRNGTFTNVYKGYIFFLIGEMKKIKK